MPNEVVPPVSETPRNWVALALLALTVATATAMGTVFSPMQELAKLDLRLTDLQVSFVQGLAVSIPIALLSLPIGRLVDSTKRTRLLLALLASSIVGTWLTAFAQGFETLFVARMLAGVAAFCCIPVAISIAADLGAADRRGRSLLLLSVGRYIGVAAAFAVGGWLGGLLAAPHAAWFPGAGLAPWREVHVVFAAASMALCLPLLALREPVRRELGDVIHPDVRATLHALWLRRRFLAPLFIGQIGVVMADMSASIWAAPVLTRNFSLAPEEFAAMMGLAVLLPGIVGSVAGGISADAGHRSGRRGGILIAAVVASGLALPGALFPSMPTSGALTALLSYFLLCGSITGLVTATTIAVYLPNELRGVCLSAFVIISSVVALGLAPTVVTLVSRLLGGEQHLSDALTITGLAFSAVSFGAFLLAAARLPSRDTIRG